MGIDYSSKILVGCHYDDLPEEIRELDNIYEWLEENNLTHASKWFDAGTDGMCIGIDIDDECEFEDLDTWMLSIKEAFPKAKELLKVEVCLMSTQDIW